MSATTIHTSTSVSPIPPTNGGANRSFGGRHLSSLASTRSSHSETTASDFSTFIDLRVSPYPASDAVSDQNPVPELIPDELYFVLRSNDLINEKGIRDYIIRKAFKAMREQHELKSSEALERLQEVYPYLQIDTIRKIIYRIGPTANRKGMI